jgi:two-component system, chemotaxis family, chemotaxis protein CheY
MLATKEMLFLIVDDQQTMRRLLKSSLRQLDYKNFKEAENVLEALGILKSAPIDFVILDWSMPGEPGISLLKQIKASEEWQKIPVLMVTSESDQEIIMEAIKAKVDGYILKPVNTKILAEKINGILKL